MSFVIRKRSPKFVITSFLNYYISWQADASLRGRKVKTYLVGGSVRDKFLGKRPRDTDYVVTGASEQELRDLGLRKVGQSFSVFLDPKNSAEYTLAHSLEEDLARRDLTINAMAIDQQGIVVDLFGGLNDLKDKVLRHVLAANFFSDPLRVLRTARFKAQFPSFEIAANTKVLMSEAADTPAYKTLIPERIIKELKRAFEARRPSLFFETLLIVKALRPHFQEFSDLSLMDFEVSMDLLDTSPRKEPLQFASLVSKLTLPQLSELVERLQPPLSWTETASAWIHFQKIRHQDDPEELVNFLYGIDAFRKSFLVDALADLGPDSGGKLREKFLLIKNVGIKDLEDAYEGKEIAQAIKQLRISRLISHIQERRVHTREVNIVRKDGL
jgi:tRNA nucleotidyltransferase (CCA-adding enzyme)